MARAFLRSFEAHSCSYVTKMIVKTHRQGAFAVAEVLPRRLLARTIYEDSPFSGQIDQNRGAGEMCSTLF